MPTKAGGAARRARLREVPEATESGASSNHINNNSTTTTSTTMTTTTTTTTTGKPGGVSRLPSIKERRPSVQKKARTSSVNDAANDPTTTASTTSTSLQRQESSNNTATATSTTSTIQRRASVPQGPSTQSTLRGSRPSFAGIGQRVSRMVRCRMAFQNRRKSSNLNSENEPNHMEHIHEMPRNPRFTTFLSAEAQYAMMKGYEDKLYEKIAKTNPESRLVLKRTKTPFHTKVSIVDNEAKKKEGGGGGGGGEGGESGENKSPAQSSGYGSQGSTPTATTTASPSPDGSGSSDTGREASTTTTITTLPSPFSHAGRSQSVVSSYVSKSMTSSSHSMAGGVGFALHRSSSLPTLDEGLSHKKRLVLTYRLESAMDILDTLKRRNKENSLSPRVFRIPRQVDAVRDFNSWTKVWNKEFKVVHSK